MVSKEKSIRPCWPCSIIRVRARSIRVYTVFIIKLTLSGDMIIRWPVESVAIAVNSNWIPKRNRMVPHRGSKHNCFEKPMFNNINNLTSKHWSFLWMPGIDFHLRRTYKGSQYRTSTLLHKYEVNRFATFLEHNKCLFDFKLALFL